MKKVFILPMLLIMMLIACNSTAQNVEKEIMGAWDYTAEQAPYEYQKGQVVFFEEDGETMAKIVIEDVTLDTQDLTIDGTNIVFVAFVDYEPVTIALELKDGKLAGNVGSPEGALPIALEKAKK
jgi:hypothetical protein